jgi:single-strand DNA-binding protein
MQSLLNRTEVHVLDMAQVTIIGRLGKDPETRQAGSSTVVEFSLAVNDGTKDRPHTSWFRVQAWDEAGEQAMTYLHKGDQAGVVGDLKEETWTKDGAEVRAHRVTARRVRFGAKATPKDGTAPATAKPASDDDCPF